MSHREDREKPLYKHWCEMVNEKTEELKKKMIKYENQQTIN